AAAHAFTTVRGAPGRWLVRAALPLALGLVVPIALWIGWQARLGLLDLVRWTTFVEPRVVLTTLRGTHVQTLLDGITWFGLHWAPVIGLAGAGAVHAVRTRDRLGLSLIAWVAGGAAMVLLQRPLWWQYHWLTVAPPLGVLAADGMVMLSTALAGAAPARRAAALACALLFSGLVLLVLAKAVLLAR